MQNAAALGIFDHCNSWTVFHASARVHVLDLSEYEAFRGAHHLVEADEGRAAYSLERVFVIAVLGKD
jgi:hypothetical protein